MNDFAFDFQSAKEGLLTLEGALTEMLGGLPETESDTEPSGKDLLENPTTRDDIELESIEKGVKGLWNSRASRAVFLEIIQGCKTVGFLVLGLELLCRNTYAYIDSNTTVKSAPAVPEATPYDVGPTRSSRRSVNSWQQEDSSFYEDLPVRSSRRVPRVNYMGLD